MDLTADFQKHLFGCKKTQQPELFSLYKGKNSCSLMIVCSVRAVDSGYDYSDNDDDDSDGDEY